MTNFSHDKFHTSYFVRVGHWEQTGLTSYIIEIENTCLNKSGLLYIFCILCNTKNTVFMALGFYILLHGIIHHMVFVVSNSQNNRFTDLLQQVYKHHSNTEIFKQF